MIGITNATRDNAVGLNPGYMPSGNPGMNGGNTYTGTSTDPTIQDYENVFGPSARDIKQDLQRFKRHGRWHLPDVLKGPNPWLTDRIDGLITDTTNSPFTTKILPYRFKEDPDAKMKWNVWTFDEGMASRVPYETAARTLTQSKRSFSGYMVRQGMAISLEHNFMMSPKGREDFKNQLNQLIGSIQYTNDLDVHMALVLAPSYEKFMRERYYNVDKSPSQVCREFVDLFGMCQKNTNALDILIEEAKATLKTWGSPMPDFLLCNSKMTFQLTMTPEKTNYITQGYDGVKRLKNGPDLASYRGISVIHSRSFSMETGQHPRDILRRRVRTAEYYRITPHKDNYKREFEFYNEERDTWFTLSFKDLLRMARYEPQSVLGFDGSLPGATNHSDIDLVHDSLHAKLADSLADGRFRTDLGFLGAVRHSKPVITHERTGKGNPHNMAFLERIKDLLKLDIKHTVDTDDYPIPFHWPNMSFPDNPQANNMVSWIASPFSFDLGIKQIPLRGNHEVEDFQRFVSNLDFGPTRSYLQKTAPFSLSICPRINSSMEEALFRDFKAVPLNHPFKHGVVCTYPSPDWYFAYTFWLTVFKRSGIPLDYIGFTSIGAVYTGGPSFNVIHRHLCDNFKILDTFPPADEIDLSCQILTPFGFSGGVNDIFNVARSTNNVIMQDTIGTFPEVYNTQFVNAEGSANLGKFIGSVIVLSWEVLRVLVPFYETPNGIMSGFQLLRTIIGPLKAELLHRCFTAYTNNTRPNGAVNRAGGYVITGDFINGRVDLSIAFVEIWEQRIAPLFSQYRIHDARNAADSLAEHGINTWPMGVSTLSHFVHPSGDPRVVDIVKTRDSILDTSFGHVNIDYLRLITTNIDHPWGLEYFTVLNPTLAMQSIDSFASELLNTIETRIFKDGRLESINVWGNLVRPLPMDNPMLVPQYYLEEVGLTANELGKIDDPILRRRNSPKVSSVASSGLGSITVNYQNLFRSMPSTVVPPIPSSFTTTATATPPKHGGFEDVEIVIIRPNIEHTMLGIILGLGGDSLGNTLWGQTELSVYDDSMYGIWGMSYKYHERAIVFNEKNLIRLWDVAYDGYNGGKDDTYVDWTREDGPNGCSTFKNLTLDVSQNYRGPSMMVMAFVHDKDHAGADGQKTYDKHFRRNWPSPIVFHDSWTPETRAVAATTLPIDYDNIHVISVEEFRVFNNPLYSAYQQYKEFMPPFDELHKMRKSAGHASVDSETPTDSLAFQGTMRIKEDGRVVQEILGSGHHGPDYIGIASVRAGKGQKVSGQAPTLHRLI